MMKTRSRPRPGGAPHQLSRADYEGVGVYHYVDAEGTAVGEHGQPGCIPLPAMGQIEQLEAAEFVQQDGLLFLRSDLIAFAEYMIMSSWIQLTQLEAQPLLLRGGIFATPQPTSALGGGFGTIILSQDLPLLISRDGAEVAQTDDATQLARLAGIGPPGTQPNAATGDNFFAIVSAPAAILNQAKAIAQPPPAGTRPQPGVVQEPPPEVLFAKIPAKPAAEAAGVGVKFLGLAAVAGLVGFTVYNFVAWRRAKAEAA